ncbi:MAG TPA: hypothetical protein VGM87_05600 [Roseomonas sp.]|jgi:hypothetical protein
MRITLPAVPGPASAAFDAIRRAFAAVVSTQEAVPFVLLQAPDRSVWRVTVDDAGALQAEKIQG